MKTRITYYHVLLLLTMVGISSFGYAQESNSKIAADLRALSPDQTEEQSQARQRSDARVSAADLPEITAINNIQVYDGRVIIEAIAKDDPSALLADLQSLGLENGSYFGGMVSGLFPVEDIQQLEGVSTLRYVKPSYKPNHNVGLVTSQGDFTQYSDAAREAFGVDGTGLRVGVLSDSWDNLGGQAAGIASGDLPSDIIVLEELPGGGIDEGRAMGELIYDVAPGSSLAFHTAFLGQPDFANGILELADAGSDVIVDDIIYFAEPMFQDGIIGQAADIVSKDGVPYFSSAGNQLDDSYEATFNPSSEPKSLIGLNLETFQPEFLGEYLLHDFDPGEGEDFYQTVNFPGSLLLSFQWTDPFASVCAGCPGAENDFDIFLATVDGDETSIIFFDGNGLGPNIGLDAVEVLGLSTSGALQAYLVIGKKVQEEDAAAKHKKKDPKEEEELIKYVVFNNVVPSEYMNQSGTSYGHANAERAVSVGAVRYDRTPEFGVNPPLREVFSSSGGVPTYFDKKGKELKKPKVRKKPEISAVQGTNNTFFGFDYEGDGFPNFFGTSASAPHAAGVAALMLEAADGKLKPDKLLKAMQETAIDMDDPRTPEFDKGFDFATGYGFLQADAAVAEVVDQPTLYRYVLIDPITDTQMGTLRDGQTIQLTDDEFGVFNIEALVSEGKNKVKKVKFELESDDPDFKKYKRDEKKPPYALFGEKKGDYKEGTLPEGDYELETKVEAKKGKKKDKKKTSYISFSIDIVAPSAPVAAARSADSGGGEADAEKVAALSEQLLNSSELVVYPNPSTGIVNFIWNAGQEGRAELSIMDISGRVVEVFQSDGAFEHSIDFSRYDRGVHIARIVTPNFTEIQRFVIK